jgi:phage tail tube protein FII
MAQSLYEVTHWLLKITPSGVSPVATIPKGIITELTLPTLEREMDNTKRAGELGVVSRPKYYNEMSLEFTVKYFYKELIEALIKGTNESITLEATACLQPDTGTAKAYKVLAKGFVNSLPLGDLSSDGLESKISLMCWYLECNLDTSTIIFDPRNYILSMNGTNIFESVKTIIDPPVV